MKQKILLEKPKTDDEEMLPEYNFSGMKSVRGKYYKKMLDGYSIEVEEPDGSVTVQHIKPGESAILLEPDVRAYFPTSEAVNQALRALITVIEQTPHKEKVRAKRRAKSMVI